MYEDLSFSKQQRIGVITLLLLIGVLTILYLFLPYLVPKQPLHDPQKLKSLAGRLYIDSLKNNPEQTLRPFRFNPNTLDEEGFIRLGLSEKVAKTIIHYRNKGGHFYRKESFKKIWGLKESEYDTLANFIELDQGKSVQHEMITVDINRADTGSLIKLNGIGAYTAMNIVNYRKLLGGYTHKQQIKEVYSLREETYNRIQEQLLCKPCAIKKINLNEATLAELNKHPYLKGEIGLALVNYRKEHDYHIEKIEEIRHIPLINDELFRKIAPYITVK